LQNKGERHEDEDPLASALKDMVNIRFQNLTNVRKIMKA
jgi:hypothetical protein